MNVNFVYNDFSDDGYPLANCSKNGNSNKWFDSSNFFSSYLNDSENDFDYLGDKRWYDFAIYPEGHISLQDHPGKAYFKNIRMIVCSTPIVSSKYKIINISKVKDDFFIEIDRT